MTQESGNANLAERATGEDQAKAKENSDVGSSAPKAIQPTPEQVQALTFSDVIRELMMLKCDVETYRNVVSLGAHRTVRIAALEKAALIVERVQREYYERRKLARR